MTTAKRTTKRQKRTAATANKLLGRSAECGCWDEHPHWCQQADLDHAWWCALRCVTTSLGFVWSMRDDYPHDLLFDMRGPEDEPVFWIEPTKETVR